MARLFDTSTGQAAEVPDADAPAAVLSGRYGLDGSREVVLFDPDGKSWTMPAASAPEAFRKGYTYASQESVAEAEGERKYGALGAKLLAAGSGALRGVTFGLSDRALRNMGVQAQTLRDLQEGSPWTSGVSEAVGGVATAVLSGGASAVGGAAAKATGLAGAKGLLSRAGARAIEIGAAGAAEGALVGAGKAVTEDALGRADLTAESLIANAGLGAVIGASGGALLGGGSTLLGAGAKRAAGYASEKLGGGSVAEWLEDFAGERVLKATLGQQKRAFTQLEDKGLTDKAKKYLLEDLGLGKESLREAAGNTTEVIAEKLAERAQTLQSDLAATVQMLDDVTEGRPLQRVSPRVVARRIKKEVAEPLKRIAADRDTYKAVLDEVEAINAIGTGGISFGEARAQRAALQNKVNYDARQGLTAAATARRKAAQIWNDVIDEHAEPLLKELDPAAVKTYRDAREEFALVQRLTDYAESRAQGDAANRVLSPSDYGIGGVGGLMTGEPVTGAASAVAHKAIRERGAAVAANLAFKASRLQALQKAAKAVETKIDAAISGFLAPAMGTVTRLAPPASVRVLMSTSFVPQKAAAKGPPDRNDAAKRRAREIAELVQDPARAADRIAVALAGVDEAAPGVSGHTALTATKALQYLHTRAPKNRQSTNTLQPLLDDWRPSDQEASRFGRYVRAAMDPLSVLEDLKSGTLTPEAAETLRELYPQIHRMTLEKLTARLTEMKKKLPYEDRINLSLLLGAPVDDSMRPEAIARSQALWAKAPSEGGGQPQQTTGTLGLADNMRSATQRLEVKR